MSSLLSDPDGIFDTISEKMFELAKGLVTTPQGIGMLSILMSLLIKGTETWQPRRLGEKSHGEKLPDYKMGEYFVKYERLEYEPTLGAPRPGVIGPQQTINPVAKYIYGIYEIIHNPGLNVVIDLFPFNVKNLSPDQAAELKKSWVGWLFRFLFPLQYNLPPSDPRYQVVPEYLIPPEFGQMKLGDLLLYIGFGLVGAAGLQNLLQKP